MVILREMVQRLNPVMHEAEGLFIQLDFDSADFSSSKVFICYAREDEALTRNLYNRLLRDGFQPWLDKEDILPGQDWESEIKKAVKKCDYILVCLSKSSISKTGFVQKEIRLALDVADTQPDGSIFLIPIRLEEIDIPERLSQLQWVNYFDNEGYGRLITALHCGRSHLQKK